MRSTMRIGAAALLGGLLIAAAPAPAQAQDKKKGRAGDRKVVLKHIEMNGRPAKRGPQGCVLFLMGRNLFKPAPMPEGEDRRKWRPSYKGLTVHVDGKAAPIIESSWDHVTIIVPQSVNPGNRTIKLAVRGRGSASLKFEVVDLEKWQDSADAKQQQMSESGRNDARERRELDILQSFKITKFDLVKGPAGNTFEVKGKAGKIEDRLRLQVKLRFDERTIKERALPVLKGEFGTTFGPYPQKLLKGNYSIEIVFELAQQSRVRVRRWLRTLSDEERQLYSKIIRRSYTQVGTGPKGEVTPADTAKQTEALKAHTLEHIQASKKLLQTIRDAYACAARCYFKPKGSPKFDETGYTKWLQKDGFATSNQKLKEILKDTRFASKSGHFKAREYQEWVEKAGDGLLAQIKGVHKKHRKFNDQYLCSPDQRADRLGDFMLSIIVKLFNKWSEGLYAQAGMDIPDVMRTAPVSPVEAPTISQRFFDAKRRELLRQVGLDEFVEQK